jgi:hypothetical protein
VLFVSGLNESSGSQEVRPIAALWAQSQSAWLFSTQSRTPPLNGQLYGSYSDSFIGYLSAISAFETARGFHLGRISGSS